MGNSVAMTLLGDSGMEATIRKFLEKILKRRSIHRLNILKKWMVWVQHPLVIRESSFLHSIVQHVISKSFPRRQGGRKAGLFVLIAVIF